MYIFKVKKKMCDLKQCKKFATLESKKQVEIYKNSIEFSFLDSAVKLPKKATRHSVGYDVFSTNDITVEPGQRYCVNTGLSIIDMPDDIYIQIASRSGLAFKKDLEIFPGIIDPDFLNKEIKILMRNRSNEVASVKKGDAIAQLIIHQKLSRPMVHYSLFGKCEKLIFEEEKEKEDRIFCRGIEMGESSVFRIGGFGSTE